VSDFQVGDTVCADLGLCETCVDPKPAQGNAGAFAPFAAVPASLCAKTDGVDPVAAAGLPLAGLTAYQALFTKAGRTFTGDTLGDLKPGQKLCIIGGATAVGAFAIQLAKNAGAFVACTASSNDDARGVKKTEACKALGADVVIDYGNEEWSDVLNGQEYDLVFDTIGKQEDWANAAKVLKKGGDFISVANFAADAAANESNVFKNFLLKSDGGDLRDLVAMVKAGKLTVPVDSVVPFADVPAALAKSSAQANAGKIVVDVAK
jgi:NADPH:quinone reductase-like Zn-dependent oxidoreductase